MNQYDIYNMFETIDKDRNGFIDEPEWQEFYSIFLLPFKQKCDLNL